MDNLHVCHRHPGTDYIIKVNLRKTPKEMWLTIAETKGIACQQREGITEYVDAIEFKEKGFDGKLRQVFHVIQRTMDGRPTAAHPRDRGSCVLDLATLRAMARDRTVS
ncbi:hypothetical protein [Paenibacillus hemerocallicola]|uniref:hypothetical protein n=1 Tax=Paenibacillus hemerocallicola TaxID=1172614 RepID=UPI003CCC851D